MSNFNNEIIEIVSKINHLRYVDKNIDSIQYYYNELYELTKKISNIFFKIQQMNCTNILNIKNTLLSLWIIILRYLKG